MNALSWPILILGVDYDLCTCPYPNCLCDERVALGATCERCKAGDHGYDLIDDFVQHMTRAERQMGTILDAIENAMHGRKKSPYLHSPRPWRLRLVTRVAKEADAKKRKARKRK